MGETEKSEEALKAHAAGSRLVELKMKKSRSKAAFTRTKNKLIHAINDEESSEELFTELIEKLEVAMDESVHSIENLCKEYEIQKKTTEMLHTISEVEEIEKEYEKVLKQYHALESDTTSETLEIDKADLGKDMWKQLKRVSIPVFDGETKRYETWKSAFMACVDSAPATKEYKLLQLRQYLKGNALKAIEDLGHSGSAYDAAKQRLDRKYGGERRKVGKYMEDIEKFPPMTVKNAKSLDKFSDLLDVAVINIKEAGLESELGTGMMYIALQKKLPEQMLTSYHRWIVENDKKESVDTLKDFVNQEAEYHIIAQETKFGIGATGTSPVAKPYKQGNRSFHTNTGRIRPTRSCKICTGNHTIWRCEKFKNLSVSDRWDKAKEHKLCYRCLKDNHFGNDCWNYKICGINNCKKTHDKLLHVDETSVKKPLNVAAAPYQPENITGHCDSKTSTYIALRTIPVIVKSNGKHIKVNALLDDGSTKTYINADIASELGLRGEVKQVSVNVLDGQVNSFDTMPVTLEVQSMDKNVSFEVNAFTTNRVTGNMEVIDWNTHAKKFPHLNNINFPIINPSRPIVDILIGLDHQEIHRSIKEVYGQPGEPYARLGPLGWTCVGKPCSSNKENQAYMSYFLHDDLGSILKDFWEIENVPAESSRELLLSPKDKQVLIETEQSMKYENGRYQVGIPWNTEPPKRNNYEMARVRLENTEKKLSKIPEIEEIYIKTINQYEEKGYITKANSEGKENKQRWYLPHFPVVRLNKDTTKVRIVFDASAKYEHQSLNDCINEGPKLQNELFNVLLRFRKYPVAIVCDISEMYLQIVLKPEDRPYHSFLWNSGTNQPDIYEFNRVVFGVNASPFLAMFVSRQNAEKHKSVMPLAAETILKSTYMDDSMDSVLNDEIGVQLYFELSALWKKAGMFARKWLSNSTKVLQAVPEEDRATEIDLESGSLPTKKTLGILWQTSTDMFTFQSNNDVYSEKYTKRFVLKVIARLFDPLGFVSPFVVKGKMLMQKLWCDGYDWDDIISNDLKSEIDQWFTSLSDMNDIRIDRSLNFNEDVESSTIHVFVDASELAYAATVYVRHVFNNGTLDIRLVCSKTKVAPLKAMSIPRLELMAAVLGVRLADTVVRALQMKPCDVVYWSDSMNVLWWIHRESRTFKPFVANHVSEIHDKSVPNQWRHVPSKENPADIASRGMAAFELVECEMWWKGPEFLMRAPENWPKNEVGERNESNAELRSKAFEQSVISMFVVTEINEEVIDIDKYSRWHKLVRVLAWILRFISNISFKRNSRRQGELKADEVKSVEIVLIRTTQSEYLYEDRKCLTKGNALLKHSKIVQLNPKLDEDGLLRCDTRLKFAKFLSFDARFPIILPRKSRITKLIVKHYHEINQHGGTNQVLSSVSTRFWIEAAREVIRDWERECSYCKRIKSKSATQVMAPLPDIRLDMPMRAFAHTAVDYAGPFITIQGRGKRCEKRYLCLFTCLASRAVHLEMAYGLDTSSFLNAFYRFTSRRGVPVVMNSDNGTNFVGADRELRTLVDNLDADQIQKHSSDKKIQWEFNPPSAPHFGGVYEAMIKSAKRAINKILGNADVTDEELSTAFVGAEGLLNSRPLTYQSSNPNDDVVLTPNHFLHGQLGGEFAPNVIDSTPFDPRKRWRYVQELVKHVWRRWMREFLPTLSGRKKWFKTERDFKPGDVVIVIDTESPRGQWPLGRITEVFPGKDGHVRVVSVRIGSNVLKRPISKLCFLEHCAL